MNLTSSKTWFFTVFFVVLSTVILYTILCFFLGFLILSTKEKINIIAPNSNLVRSSYPNYDGYEAGYARKIFEDYSAPTSSYKSFIGYRRDSYKGVAVNINDSGFRDSLNHDTENSVWFMGGSTMWGTGSADENTIPSYFAQLSGHKVWNLGESGFNSFQELIQLQMLLAEGYKPKAVIFYDGVNDGYDFCQNDELPQLRHAYTSRFMNMSEELKKAEAKLLHEDILNYHRLEAEILSFYLRPLSYLKELENLEAARNQKTSSTPILEMTANKRYLVCNDSKTAQRAANITTSAWNSAFSILTSLNIPVWFVLQPTATYMPEEYKLDYIIDKNKRDILNEKDSYERYYPTLKSQFEASCGEYGNCSSFIDLSELFIGRDEPIFIDTCHVSPNGNRLVAEALLKSVDI